MRKIVLLVFCVVYSLAGYCQNFDEPKGKPTVFIDYFKRSSDAPFSWVEGLRNTVIEGIQKMERVILIDVDAQDALRIESQRRSSLSDGRIGGTVHHYRSGIFYDCCL